MENPCGKIQQLHWPINKRSHETAITQPNSVWMSGHLGNCCAPFNRSLILATWFIHVATTDITTLINHAVQHAGRPHTRAGLTNLNTIFHLNNLALPQGRPAPDTADRRESLLILLFLWLLPWHKVFLQPCQSRQTLSCALQGRSLLTLNLRQWWEITPWTSEELI